MIICQCEGVRESEVRCAVRCGARDVKSVGRMCGAGSGCTDCHKQLKKVIADETAEEQSRGLEPIRTLLSASAS